MFITTLIYREPKLKFYKINFLTFTFYVIFNEKFLIIILEISKKQKSIPVLESIVIAAIFFKFSYFFFPKI